MPAPSRWEVVRNNDIKAKTTPAWCAVLLVLAGCAGEATPGPTARDEGPPAFAGRQACVRCHPEQASAWRGSHHDLAMEEATAENVLGDFDAGDFEVLGVRASFSRRQDGFYVRTDGGDDRIAYTFGVTPLQQYLVDVGGGRLQVLPFCWDTRPAADGGQRWFYLYDEPILPDDPLHWTGFFQNWNYMCADCHSTGVDPGYDAVADRFETTWTEIDVSCEACHGPASRHVASPQVATVVHLKRPEDGWTFVGGAATAHLGGGPESVAVRRAQTDACARCHSRRTSVARYEPGGAFHDAFDLALLEGALYYADGQILDEVYVYGSFLQSKMYAAGVTCSDCHDPHSARLLLDGNALCTRCHRGTVYDVEQHHRHRVGTPGSACVDCHMPARTYMVVDPRRDHSFRVPRPDLSVRLGTPNACAGCHDDRDDAWAASVTEDWGVARPFHYGEAFHAARTWQVDAETLLLRVLGDPAQPAIVRASALASLRDPSSALPAVERALADPAALVRRGALAALAGARREDQLRLAGPLVQDPVLTVRTEAARLLAWMANEPEAAEVPFLHAVLDEYRATLQWRADRPDTYYNLGNLELGLGDAGAAEASYRRALEMLPSLGGAAVNLADLYRATGRDADAESVLRRALERAPADAALHHSLGLALIRRRRPAEALESLRRAYELAPEEPRYAYVYGVALYDTGKRAEGLRLLEDAARRFPGYQELVSGYRALASVSAGYDSVEQGD